MADRFPLILNTSTNQIQEIPSGDNLDLTGVNINNVGVITCGNVRIGTGTTDLVVTGDARITGILTIGTSSLKLDGPNNLVNVGTALTLGHTQGLQFHTQNLHSAGFEVNQINASGIITATGADINGDIDVDGHTNLDNVNVAGVSTFAGNADFSAGVDVIGNITGSANVDIDGQIQVGSVGSYFKQNQIRSNASGAMYIDHGTTGQDINFRTSNSSALDTTGISIKANGNVDFANGIDVTGNATVSGNLSVGGVLTYEDVTNVDSVGIITARSGVRVNSGGIKVTSGVSYFNANIVGTATTAISITTTDESSDTSCNVLFATAATGNLAPKTGSNLTFNSSTGLLVASGFSGDGSSLSGLNGSQITSGTVPVARIGTGTKNTSTFYRGDGTFATVTPPAITAISNATNNRVITSEGGTTVNAESNLTFDGGRLITKQGDSDIGMLIQNTSHDSQLRIETVAANKNSVIMFADGDDGDVGMIDYDHNDNSLGFTVNASERLLIDSGGTATFISNADGVINVNTSASNGAFMRFRKQSSNTNIFHCGAAKGIIGSWTSANDGAVNAPNGDLYVRAQSGTIHFTDASQQSSGIDVVCRGGGTNGNDGNTQTSPFIRFRDYPTGQYANATTVDDNNWAIGADDSGVSQFVFVYGGGANSNLVTDVTAASRTGTAVLTLGSDLKLKTTGFEVQEIAELAGTSTVGSTTRNAHYDATPNRGTYLVHGHFTYRESAPGGDPDQIRLVLQVDGSDIAHASILDEDSSNISRNQEDSFTAMITVNGSQNVQVESYTTDPSDSGGGDYRYRINIYKIG